MYIADSQQFIFFNLWDEEWFHPVRLEELLYMGPVTTSGPAMIVSLDSLLTNFSQGIYWKPVEGDLKGFTQNLARLSQEFGFL